MSIKIEIAKMRKSEFLMLLELKSAPHPNDSFGLHRSVFWLWREIVLGVTYFSTIPVGQQRNH
jgi:hypothetical protein